MSCVHWAPPLAALLLLGCVGAIQDSRPTQTAGEARMTEMKLELPFGLREDELKGVEILLGMYPAKTGAGKQEITIRGDGRVTLMRTKSYDAAPERREAQLAPEALLRLLELIEDEDFLALDEIYPTKTPVMRRIIRFSVPGKSKVVAVDEPGPLEFERVIGAIRLAAGLATPEALHRRFLTYR